MQPFSPHSSPPWPSSSGGPAALLAQDRPAARRRQHRRRGPVAADAVPDRRDVRARRAAAGQLPRHPAGHHGPLPDRAVRRRRWSSSSRSASGLMLIVRVKERPVLEKWAVRGVTKLAESEVKGRVKLSEGRPLDRNAVEQSRASIDSLYKHDGLLRRPDQGRSSCRRTTARFASSTTSNEGQRVAISQVVVEGNKRFGDKQVVKHMATRPEGFWWFRKGEYDERKVDQDVRERLPRWYADNGLRRFPGDARLAGRRSARRQGGAPADGRGGPAVPGRRVRHRGRPPLLDRGAAGASIRSARSGPDGTPRAGAPVQPRRTGTAATEKVQNLYANNGYIYAQVEPRRPAAPAPTASRSSTSGGPSARARRPRSTRSRSWATTSPTSG